MKEKLAISMAIVFFVSVLFMSVGNLNAMNDGSGWYQIMHCHEAFPKMCPDGGGCSVRKDSYIAIQCKIFCSFSDGFREKHRTLSCYNYSEVIAFWGWAGGVFRDIINGFWNYLAR